MEDKFILHRLVRASSCLSLATDLAFKYSSDWFHARMCRLLDWENFLPGFLVFTEADMLKKKNSERERESSITDLNSRAYFKKLWVLKGIRFLVFLTNYNTTQWPL